MPQVNTIQTKAKTIPSLLCTHFGKMGRRAILCWQLVMTMVEFEFGTNDFVVAIILHNFLVKDQKAVF